MVFHRMLLLFNIFINDLFLFVSNSHLSNYADDNTLHAFGYNMEEIENIHVFFIRKIFIRKRASKTQKP